MKEEQLNEEHLNEEYKLLNSKIIELNKQRYEVYKKFKKLNPNTILEEIRTISFYHDLYGVETVSCIINKD